MSIEENKRVVESYLMTVGSGTVAPGILDDNAKWWLPRLGVVEFADLAKIMERVGPLLKDPVKMTIDHITAEGDRVSVEASGHTTTTTGKDYNNVYHFLFFLRNGKITEIHEHGDSAYAFRVFGFNPSEHLEAR